MFSLIEKNAYTESKSVNLKNEKINLKKTKPESVNKNF